MRVDVIIHEIGAMSAEDVAQVAVAAVDRIGEIGRDAGEAFKAERTRQANPNLDEGMEQILAD